jgi:hypothetical protein
MALNNDTVQQYIDHLQKDCIEANQDLNNAKAQEADNAGLMY